jgi:hypothetical protein
MESGRWNVSSKNIVLGHSSMQPSVRHQASSSISTISGQDSFYRSPKDDDVTDEGPVLDVEEIKSDSVVPGEVGPPAYLPETRNPGLYKEATMYVSVVLTHLPF